MNGHMRNEASYIHITEQYLSTHENIYCVRMHATYKDFQLVTI